MSFFWYSYWFYWRFIYLRRCHQFHWILAVLFESAFVIFCAILFPSMSPVVSAFFWISRIEAVLNGSEFYIWVFCVAQAFLPKLSPMFFGKHKIQRFWNKFISGFNEISHYIPLLLIKIVKFTLCFMFSGTEFWLVNHPPTNVRELWMKF